MHIRAPRSLVGRLILGNIVVTLFLAALLPAIVSDAVLKVADHTVSRELNADANTLASAVRWRDGTWSLVGDPYAMSALAVDDPATGFALLDAGGKLLQGSPSYRAIAGKIGARYRNGFGERGDIAYFLRPVSHAGNRASILVFRDRGAENAFVDKVTSTMSLGISGLVVLVLAGSLVVNIAIVLLAMRSLDRASRQAARIDLNHLDRRIDERGLPDDVLSLVRATNALLDRVEQGFHFRSRFAGAVAHELRTPIAVLRLKCEALPPTPQREELLAAVDRQADILRQLRTLASIDGEEPRMAVLDLVPTVREAASELAIEVLRSGRSIEFLAPSRPVPVVADPGHVTTIVQNLIANAMRHTPEGTHIVVAVDTLGALDVADDGPGIVRAPHPERLSGEISYARADYRRDSKGSGLGFRIITRSAEVMTAQLEVATGGPGCRVRVVFQPATGDPELAPPNPVERRLVPRDKSSPITPIPPDRSKRTIGRRKTARPPQEMIAEYRLKN